MKMFNINVLTEDICNMIRKTLFNIAIIKFVYNKYKILLFFLTIKLCYCNMLYNQNKLQLLKKINIYC